MKSAGASHSTKIARATLSQNCYGTLRYTWVASSTHGTLGWCKWVSKIGGVVVRWRSPLGGRHRGDVAHGGSHSQGETSTTVAFPAWGTSQQRRSISGWVPEGNLAGFFGCREAALELVCGADFSCKLMCAGRAPAI